MFCQTPIELQDSLSAFISNPDLHGVALGTAPKYFVHQIRNDVHYFGLSKFCAFKGITLPEYRSNYRHKRNGEDTQNHIQWLMNQSWVKYKDVHTKIQSCFSQWIHQHLPNCILSNASFISLNEIKTNALAEQSVTMTPAQLEQKLKRMAAIGAAGEKIAVEYEKERLAGIRNANIDEVFQRNVAAGFDIRSETTSEVRFIEVKSSTKFEQKFFLSSKEYEVLKGLTDEAYLYLVRVDDVENAIGEVVREIKNPISKLK